MMFEMGGFIPFTLPTSGKELFSPFENEMVRVNSGRTGILYALRCINPKKVYIPYYNCPEVISLVKKECPMVEMYQLNEDFSFSIPCIESDACVLYTNYFGLINKKAVQKLVDSCSSIILDNTQAFYEKPILKAYNVYSCRKLFCVPDGGYVIHKKIEHLQLSESFSYNRCEYLLKGLELGNNAAYDSYLDNEERLCLEYARMSRLTERLLCTQDYQTIAEIRKRNYDYIDSKLGKINEIHLKRDGMTPYVYPFYYKKNGIHEMLKERSIYISRWWKHVWNDLSEDAFECKLARYLLPLPIDQRYGKDELDYMVKNVMECIL